MYDGLRVLRRLCLHSRGGVRRGRLLRVQVHMQRELHQRLSMFERVLLHVEQRAWRVQRSSSRASGRRLSEQRVLFWVTPVRQRPVRLIDR